MQDRSQTGDKHARLQLQADNAITESDNTARNQSATLAPFTGKTNTTAKLTTARCNLLYAPARIGEGYLDTLIDTETRYTLMDMSVLEIISKKGSTAKCGSIARVRSWSN
jgi:hypothetical protein